MESMKDWVVVSSRSGKCEDGIPVGQFLCRSTADANEVIEKHKIRDAVITRYLEQEAVRIQDGR